MIRGVLDRVDDQVADHLAQANGVANQRQAGHRESSRVMCVLFFPDPFLQTVDNLVNDRGQLDDFFARIKPGFNSPQIQQVIDQGGDVVDTELDAMDELALLLINRACPADQFHVAQDSRQR